MNDASREGGKRTTFSHADIVTMTKAYAQGGRSEVYKHFPHIHNGVIDDKLIELGIMERPQRPALPPEQKQSIVGEIVGMMDERVPVQHQPEAARAIMLELRNRYIPKRTKAGE